MINFQPRNWYWIVAGNPGVYSSASNVYVPATDPVYLAWLAAGFAPGRIASEAEIWPYVAGFLPDWLFNSGTFAQPGAGIYSTAQLVAYAASVRYAREIAGINVNGVSVTTDRQSQAMINGGFNMALHDPTFTTQWKTASGGFIQVDAPTMIAIATGVGQHVAVCFAKEAAVIAGIAAGTIKVPAEIDSAFAGI
ncbi:MULTISPECIES: DUF4376 domain-containing protein [unclassified Bradyrhizobium]|uniref:DUF4376 domain-containing protein n=1 Tax=unclassified Bradyrhizobium TaxID=2631580 RepID=UPI002916D41E|nr:MULTISPECIES: DUF4376 domain-containing protein [unclassified Bradyrhizobium]